VLDLYEKSAAAKALNCQLLVVPHGNTDGGITECNGVPVKGVKNLKELLHYAFKKEDEGE